jgi:hypothetical protein
MASAVKTPRPPLSLRATYKEGIRVDIAFTPWQ